MESINYLNNFVELSVNNKVYELECILCYSKIPYSTNNDISIKNHYKKCIK